MARTNENARPLLFFPESLPPFRALFADQEERLFVLTFEPTVDNGEYMIDVFNPEGVFTGRMFYIREKTDGFKQLVVERILNE